ncbi:HAD family hydrolase [Methylococcus sp. EFPC2]|uniref:HAD family hydrolase n=1 Tax=Methylococcus sp. EFPC2 TaxID=2812648 RepID=UPI0019681D25|nr:HAD family hydrolase [Methylococcus sp. EFPC2]QSA96456.1 HAD family hydrolase [Methylococcus sp. EFPC2]
MLEALIFDVDGTLADTERQGHRVAFNLAFAEAGLDWVWDEGLYGELLAVTGGKERMRYFIERFLPEPPIGTDDLGNFIDEMQARKTRHYTALVASGGIPARPGVIRLLKEARAAGLRLAIATTTTPENVDALLAASFGADAPGWFEVIGAGDIVPKKKPAPDIYRYVLAALNLPAEVCLAFEDSENGLRSSHQAGIDTVVSVNDYTAGQDFGGALLVVDHLGEPHQPPTCLTARPWEDFNLVDIDALNRLHALAKAH